MLPSNSSLLLQQEYLRGLYRQESPNRASTAASALVALQLQQQLNEARLRLLQSGSSLFPSSTSFTSIPPLVSAMDHERILLSQAIQRTTESASGQLHLGLLEAMNYRQQEHSRFQDVAALTSLPTTQSESIHSVSTNSSLELAANGERASLPATQTLHPLEKFPSDTRPAKAPAAAHSTSPPKRLHTDISASTKANTSNGISTKGAKTPNGVSTKDNGPSQASPFFAMSPLPGSAAYPAYRAYQKKKGILNRNGKKSLKWYTMLEQLKQYKEEHGNCIVPRGFAPNSKLASWVAEQR